MTGSAPVGDHRLGFSIRVFGAQDLPSHDGRGDAGTHLSVNLAYLRDICLYLQANRIHLYRMHSQVVPAALHADLDALARQLDECRAQLEQLRDLVARAELRLTFHPYSQVTLNALNEDQADAAVRSLTAHAMLLGALCPDPESVVVLHGGGVYDNPSASRERFVRRYQALPGAVRRRVALEQDDRRFSHTDTRWIHEACGVPLVLDSLHHQVLNPDRVPMREALAYALGTWPEGVRPKVHYATARSEMRTLEGSGRIKTPDWHEHGDFVVPFAFIDWFSAAQDLPAFDIMLEAKARDVALLKLREDLARFAPELVGRFA